MEKRKPGAFLCRHLYGASKVLSGGAGIAVNLALIPNGQDELRNERSQAISALAWMPERVTEIFLPIRPEKMGL